MTVYVNAPRTYEETSNPLIFQCVYCQSWFRPETTNCKESSFCSYSCSDLYNETDDEDFDAMYRYMESKWDPGYIYDLTHMEGE